jgi:hypothetical protein
LKEEVDARFVVVVVVAVNVDEEVEVEMGVEAEVKVAANFEEVGVGVGMEVRVDSLEVKRGFAIVDMFDRCSVFFKSFFFLIIFFIQPTPTTHTVAFCFFSLLW